MAPKNNKSPGAHGHAGSAGGAAAGPHAGQASIRQAYDAMGVQQFYASHGARYTNPHEGQIFAALCQLLDSTPAAVWLGLQELSGQTRQHQQQQSDADAEEGEGEGEGEGEEDGQDAGAEGEGQHDGGGAGGGGACGGYRACTAEEAAAIAAAVTAGLAAPVPLRVLDLACGSGEASACLMEWNRLRPLGGRPAAGAAAGAGAGAGGGAGAGAGAGGGAGGGVGGGARGGGGAGAAAGAGAGGGGAPGVPGVGGTSGGKRSKQRAAPPPLLPYELRLTACDPYTRDAYVARTGRAAESWSFEDIADGCIDDYLCYGGGCSSGAAATAGAAAAGAGAGAAAAAAGAGSSSSGGGGGGGSSSGGGGGVGVAFDLVVCSFALHLCEASRLYGTLTALARSARWLLVLAPHKLPYVRQEYGWRLERLSRVERTHVRLYRSLAVPAADAAAAAEVAAAAAAAVAAVSVA
ncbi:hypothetical protein CHLRE_14g627455v5 [Chlamydomonas reinhardtii]|uniref:Uncharacterized protein n=1 Tax=Chlamydomonas reinhardtii TaxID=3055 RepID=A0A2K3CYF5_CHLRE|nr:uncharacterized protein CHLRE_14g626433v5 [Chlamydomonas reinhardtii]XP_042916983.1 uncharacterized protein CHLRE_14g627455v5 [Chlamydomonas reinhardtii]PNW73285.1 hypothetical protein CHLRE_14g626433v5 [Chlamydomonas reinhardtii]PNW73313.1 hypothetical protein CHLRE_14g627455v5 [Chlamydomonas reinhardtii]